MDSTWSERLKEPFQRPDDPHHYQNLRPEPALYVLEWYIEKYKSLEWIPKPGRNFVQKGNDEVSQRTSHLFSSPRAWTKLLAFAPNLYQTQYRELKRILIDEFGWPDNFDKKKWAENRERIEYEINHRFDAPNISVSFSPRRCSISSFMQSVFWVVLQVGNVTSI